MKNLKKIMAVLIAAVMVFAMGITVFAAPTNATITIPESDNHVYNVYQIFTGELAKDADGNDVLSNVHYGAHAALPEGKAVGDPVDASVLNTMALITGTDAQKSAALAAYADLTKTTNITASAGNPASVPTGYYLVKDSAAVGDGDEATLYMLQVVGPTTITRKAGTTSSDKKVDDTNDSTGSSELLQTSSDYDIGDNVPYHVTATISDKVGQYPKYHITIEDILEDGKFDAINLNIATITLGGNAIAETTDYTVTTTWNREPTEDGFKVTYEFTPKEGKTLESLAGKTIAIDFTAKLGENAAIGSAGNRNTLKVSYSNNPNESDGHSEGKTPDKTVITFTYKVVINKVDEQNRPLSNAGFTLYKVSETDARATIPAESAKDASTKNTYWAGKALSTNGTWTDSDTSPTSFTFKGIDDGYYVLCETTTPSGYNTVDPYVFKVEATHGGDDGITLLTLTGNKVSGEITFTKDTTNDDALTATIQNLKGTVLPSTGGIGTTIFYIIGGVIVLAAVIILVVRSKKSSAK